MTLTDGLRAVVPPPPPPGTVPPRVAAKPSPAVKRTHNPLRPERLTGVIGQDRTKRFLRRVIDAAQARAEALDHMLLVGPSGVGKSTFAHIVANEIGTSVWQVEAPISHDVLLELRGVLADGDILFIDELHQQAVGDRRGRSSNTQPEVLFGVMEDRTIVSRIGVLDYPRVTVIGATTDEGLLPDAFINRFPLRPVLDAYTIPELAQIATMNGQTLSVTVEPDAALRFAKAARGVPRQINNYVRNALSLSAGVVDDALALEVIEDFNRVTEDGLTLDMQRTLVFLFSHGRSENKATGDVAYKAGVDTIATALGKSRDSKVVKLRIEPYLIQRGYLQVGHGGRVLTDAGVKRARQLVRSQP